MAVVTRAVRVKHYFSPSVWRKLLFAGTTCKNVWICATACVLSCCLFIRSKGRDKRRCHSQTSVWFPLNETDCRGARRNTSTLVRAFGCTCAASQTHNRVLSKHLTVENITNLRSNVPNVCLGSKKEEKKNHTFLCHQANLHPHKHSQWQDKSFK